MTELAAQYPELRRLPTSSLAPSIRLASALFVARSPDLSRHYVSRLSARPAPEVDA
jgi:hypothetical protein